MKGFAKAIKKKNPPKWALTGKEVRLQNYQKESVVKTDKTRGGLGPNDKIHSLFTFTIMIPSAII